MFCIPGVFLFGVAFTYVYGSFTTEGSTVLRKIVVAIVAVILASLWFLGDGGPFFQAH